LLTHRDDSLQGFRRLLEWSHRPRGQRMAPDRSDPFHRQRDRREDRVHRERMKLAGKDLKEVRPIEHLPPFGFGLEVKGRLAVGITAVDPCPRGDASSAMKRRRRGNAGYAAGWDICQQVGVAVVELKLPRQLSQLRAERASSLLSLLIPHL